jgi:hypothetical protein
MLLVPGFCLWRLSVFDPSIEISDCYPAIGGAFVENGSIYDGAAIDLTPYKAVALPEAGAIQTAAQDGKLQIFMRKQFSFAGHPPESIYLRDVRKHMGCAVQADGDTLLVATFGEWDSHVEGGASMGLIFVVPDGIEVRRRADLSGPRSVGREWDGAYLTKPKEVTEGYWYGPASPATGWSRVPDVPDWKRRARNAPPPQREAGRSPESSPLF